MTDRSPEKDRTGRRCVFPLLALCAMLACGAGCSGDGDAVPAGPAALVQIQAPQRGQVVQTHSVPVSASLATEIVPGTLRASLNGADVSSHLRLKGLSVTGNLPLSVPGQNVLALSAAAADGRAMGAETPFQFDPKAVEDVPQQGEAVFLPGLAGPVEVLVDPWGVHHIYTTGDNPDDLAYVQGYLTAKHRLYQMDFFRKVAEGRLAELLGVELDSSVLETDLFLRTMFLTYERGSVELIYDVLAEELAVRFPDKYLLLERYVAGVNDYIDDLENGRHGAALPQQYRLLNFLELIGVMPGSYEIEPMTVAQILAIGRLQQYDLSNTLYEEIDRKVNVDGLRGAEVAERIPEGSLHDLLRAEPPDHATILKPGEPYYFGFGDDAPAPAAKAAAAASPSAGSPEALRAVLARIARVERVIRGGADKPFSNNWIVSPGLTASGFALLCNDPHLGLGNPSTFYPVHGDNKTFSGGDLNFSGCTFPGVPGLMLGQNENLAWGGTVVNYDVTDVYEEAVTVNGGQKHVTYYGEQVPVETVAQRFRIRGADPVDLDIDFVPQHGPQLPGDPYSPDPGLTPEHNMTVQWTGHYLTDDLAAFMGLLEAQNMDEFFEAVTYFGVGAQNFVGADTAGEIGYYPHALVPVRKPGALTHEHPPYLPLPGTGGYEWEPDAGFRPLFLAPEQVPQARNPERGWLLTANNDVVGQTIDNNALNDPFYYSYQFDEGFRNDRATELLMALDASERDLESMKTIQSDHVSLLARRVRPTFLEAMADPAAIAANPGADPARFAEAAAYVAGWDLRCRAGVKDTLNDTEPTPADVQSSICSSIFFVWLNRMIDGAIGDELAAAGADLGSADLSRAIVHILEDVDEPPGSPYYVHTLGPDGQSLLWDDIDTPETETRDDVMVQAMVDALAFLDERMGTADMARWRWGEIHQLTLRLEALGSVIYGYNLPSYTLFQQNDAPGYPRNGGWETVDPASYGLGGMSFDPGSGPAMRMVVEMEPGVVTAYNVIPGGVNDLQPEANALNRPVQIDPETHYGDQLPLWMANQYRPQFIFVEDVTHAADYRVSFRPE